MSQGLKKNDPIAMVFIGSNCSNNVGSHFWYSQKTFGPEQNIYDNAIFFFGQTHADSTITI